MTSAPVEASVSPDLKPAIKDLRAHLRLWSAALLLLGLDLWSKAAVFARLEPTEVYPSPLIPGILVFQRSLNDGAVFGSLQGMVGLFIIASLFALGFVVLYFVGSRANQRSLHVALGLILAGALGNFYDRANCEADIVTLVTGEKFIGKIVERQNGSVRIGHWPEGEEPRIFHEAEIAEVTSQGVVRDFLKFTPEFPQWVPKLGGADVWPWIFNIADSALVCGVALLILNFWWERREHLRAEAERQLETAEPSEGAATESG